MPQIYAMANTVTAMMIVVPRSGSAKMRIAGTPRQMAIDTKNENVSVAPSS